MTFVFCLGTMAAEFDVLLEATLAANPRLGSAREGSDQAWSQYAETLAFLDPQLVMTAARTERFRALPIGSGFAGLASDATVLQGGVEIPVQPGAYAALGAAQSFLAEPDDEHGSMYQTLFGARLRIPLHRDRGFRQWRFAQARALAAYRASQDLQLAVLHEVRHDLETAYISVYAGKSVHNIVRDARTGFEALLAEARDLVALEVVPEYQVLPARLELELQREAEIQALQEYETRLLVLQELTVAEQPFVPGYGVDALVTWALDAVLPGAFELAAALERKGAYRELQSRIAYAEAELALARDDTRANVSLQIGATWQGEDPDDPFGGGRALSDEHVGGEVALVWQRPLQLRGARSRVLRHRARIAQLGQDLRQIELRVERDLRAAKVAFDKAGQRLEAIGRAAAAARGALAAERERFRLGDGRSRFVLDAQNDLTDTVRRQAEVAAELLRAHSDYRFAAGYDLTIPCFQAPTGNGEE